MNPFSPKPMLRRFFTSMICFVIAGLLFMQQATAQDFQFIPDVTSKTFNARQNPSYQFSSSHADLNVEVDKWTQMNLPGSTWDDDYSFTVIDDIIKVGLDHKSGMVDNTPYKYLVVLNITGYGAPGVSPDYNAIPEEERSFIIENNNDSLVPYGDLAIRRLRKRYYRMEIQIDNIYKYDLNNPTAQPQGFNIYSDPNLIKNFFIESTISVLRYDKLPNQKLVINALPDNNTRELLVGWAYSASSSINCNTLPANTGSVKPVKYELEWTYVDDYNFNYSSWSTGYKNTAGNFSVPYDFRNNATRIQTYNNFFRIPIIYEHGTIVFRVRAIRPDPVNQSKLIYSPWTLLQNSGTLKNNLFPINQIGASSLNCSSQCMYLISTPFEGDKFDWEYVINFAEEGKYKHVLNYFDGAGYNRQTQTKINSDNQYVIAADHIYDYAGRPAIQTLPIPVESSNLGYKSNLSYRAGSSPLSPYTAADFDNDCNTKDIPAFAGVSLAGTYYSPANPHHLEGMMQFVPDAEGYPFVQTVYSPDNTNKVLIQGGAGKNFQVDKKHVITNTYVRADQTELNQLFGTQAGHAEYYPKIVTRNPNGQLGYSIFDQSGKVIATALLGAAPDNASIPIEPLSGLPAPVTVNPTPDILANLTQATNNGTRAANYSFFPDAAGDINLSYDGAIQPYPTGCPDNYINVMGQYKTIVVGECGKVEAEEPVTWVGNSNFQSNNTPQTIAAISGGDFALLPDKYTLIKELNFPDTAIIRLADSFTNSHSGIGKCYDYEDNFIRRSVLNAKVPCKKSEEPASHCDLLKRQMMDEMYPGAKYGGYTKTEDGKFLAGLPNSIFTLMNDGAETFNPNTAYPGGGTPGNTPPPCSYTKQCSYENGGGPVNGNGLQLYMTSEVIACAPDFVPSPAPGVIYTSGNLFCQNSAVTCTDYKYRYQWCLTLPNLFIPVPNSNPPIAFNGPAGQLAPDAFIANFNDAIAEALLPFHPEYCKLLLCDDSYPTFLSTIKTYQEAKILGVANLSAIANQDPLLNSSSNPNGPFQLNDLKSFQKPASVTQQIWDASPFAALFDKQALANAYCGCESPEALAYCRNLQYKYKIDNLQFDEADTPLANTYIRNLISLYISNRTIKMQQRMENSPNSCGSICQQDFRIQQIIPPPAVADVFSGTGSNLSQTPGIPADFITQFNNALGSSTTTTPPAGFTTMDADNKRSDCEAEVMAFYNALKYWVGLSNGQGQTNLLNNLKGLAGCTNPNSLPPFNKLTPDNIKTLLGNDLNEYWNPYLAAYNIFDQAQSKPKSEFVSKHPAFYEGLKDFLNRPQVETALSVANGTSGSLTLDPVNNNFESDLAVTLGGNNITVRAYTRSVTDVYTLSIYNSVYTRNYIALVLNNASNTVLFDTLYLSKRVSTPGGYDVGINGFATSSFSFSSVQTVLSDPAYIGATGGTLRDNLVFAKVDGTANGSPASDNYIIWSYKTPMMNPKDPESIDDCINCMQIKNAVEQYFTDAPAWGLPTFVDHPSYGICLTNYLNYKLGKKHTYTEYEALMKGCALSMLPITFNKAPGQFYFNNLSEAAAATLISNVNRLNNNAAVGTEVVTNIDYFSYKSGSNVSLWFDLNSVPYDKRVNVYNYIHNNYPAALSNNFNANIYTEVLLPAAMPVSWSFIPGIHSWWGLPINIADQGTVYMKDAAGAYSIAYKKYSLSGATEETWATEDLVLGTLRDIKSNLLAQSQGFNPIFQDARALMNEADFLTNDDKQSYLSRLYFDLDPSMNAADLAQSLSPSVVRNEVYGFSDKSLMSYNNQWCKGNKTDLNYAVSPLTNPGWARLAAILASVRSQLGSNKLFPTADITTVTAPNMNNGLNVSGDLTPESRKLQIIKMANGRAWYRFFDGNNKLCNVYIIPADNMFSGGWNSGTVPGPPAANGQSGYSMLVPLGGSAIKPLPGDEGGLYRFSVNMTRTFGTGTHMVTCYGYTDFPLGASVALKDVVLSDGDSECIDTLPCERLITLAAIQQGKGMYEQYMDSIKQAHILAMREWFPSHTADRLFMKTIKQQYQFTLYNYDLAGNLTSTIPPMGVKPMSNISQVDNSRSSTNPATNLTNYPVHGKKSEYWYNSQNQLIKQKTPDAGEERFYYDKSGKLAFSQNAKQQPDGKFSYTLYDDQDRIKEAGVVYLSAPDIATNAQTRTSTQIANIVTGKPREDVVATFYDEPLLLLNTYTNENLNLQENLRRRVSSILYVPQLGASDPAASHFSYGTHFSYDAMGNVKTLVQDNPYMDYLGQRFKRVDYDYDLLSGKVNMLSYNRGKADQFYQKYAYDADNRVTKAQSSKDGLNWDVDATYTYYKHGKLAQASIGDLNVQSVQYAYTIQGWLKAINGDVLDSTADMGHDGMPDLASTDPYPMFPSDVMAHALDYHPGDYVPIGNRQVLTAKDANTVVNNTDPTNPNPLVKGLYNGNIARQTTAISHMDNLQRTYTYDQMNRIIDVKYHNVNNLTKAVTDMAAKFASTYQYDNDGNIKTLLRKDGDGNVIDNLAYKYEQPNLNANNEAKDNNWLQYVTDQNGTTAGLPGSQSAGNFKYDQIGNLIKDAQGSIENIKWNAYGKITDVQIDGDNKRIHYDYDAMGNRVRKDVLTRQGQDYMRNSEVYVRDGSGNILAVYKGKSTIDNTYTIAWANGLVNDFHGGSITVDGFGIAPFLAVEFGNDGQFTNTLFDLAQVQDFSWCESMANSLNLSGYFQVSDQLYRQAVADNFDGFFDDLRTHDRDNNGTVIGGCFSYTDLITRDFSAILSGLMLIDAKLEPMAEQRLNAAFVSMSMNAPEFTENLMGTLAMPYDLKDHQLNASNLLKNVEINGDKGIMPVFNSTAETYLGQVQAFATSVVLDPDIIDLSWLNSHSAAKRGLLDGFYNTTQREATADYLDGWFNDNNPGWLVNSTSLNDRLNIVFQKDKVDFMTKYVDHIGMESVNTAILSISQMTLSGYIDRLWRGVQRGTLNPNYTPPNVITPDPSNLLADRLDLAEHHLYGSSRLGIKTYPEAQYRVEYTTAQVVGGGIIHNVSGTLPEHTPWYSGGYATWILKDKTDPFTGSSFNQAYNVNMENIRTLGMKHYMLTDNLGNVFATVLDKKTGFGDLTLGSGTVYHVYKGFYANLSSVTDYYPFGMMMPGRSFSADMMSFSKFGYNGQLRTDEVYGNGNLNTAEYWEYDTRLGRRWNLDPDYTAWESRYAVNRNNPLCYTDPKGDDPLTGVIDALSSFALSASMDFLTSWLIDGNTVEAAFDDIGWVSASWDAAKAYALATVSPPGMVTASKVYKLAKTPGGKIITTVMEKMVTKGFDNYTKGKYNGDDGKFSFKKVEITELFMESLFETLVEKGFGSKGDELIEAMRKENSELYEKLVKLRNKVENGESFRRIYQYSQRVTAQGQKAYKATAKFVKNKAQEKVETATTSKIVNNKRKEATKPVALP